MTIEAGLGQPVFYTHGLAVADYNCDGWPDLLVTGALHDPRVMVFEPAKWVAALRASDPAWSPRCLFRVETGAGSHVGPSGRYAHLAYEAEVYAWVLDKLGAG